MRQFGLSDHSFPKTPANSDLNCCCCQRLWILMVIFYFSFQGRHSGLLIISFKTPKLRLDALSRGFEAWWWIFCFYFPHCHIWVELSLFLWKPKFRLHINSQIVNQMIRIRIYRSFRIAHLTLICFWFAIFSVISLIYWRTQRFIIINRITWAWQVNA
jgi:hypothetical protein